MSQSDRNLGETDYRLGNCIESTAMPYSHISTRSDDASARRERFRLVPVSRIAVLAGALSLGLVACGEPTDDTTGTVPPPVEETTPIEPVTPQ